MKSFRARRVVAVLVMLIVAAIPLSTTQVDLPTLEQVIEANRSVTEIPGDLATLPVKGRAPKTGYARSQFGNGWAMVEGCDMRNRILARDLTNITLDTNCKVLSGTLSDPYTGKTISFTRGEATSDDVQIDHVVALSNAWQTGAQQLTYEERIELANDPLNLMAVDGATNEQKSDSDAATWLPPNKAFRCTYVKRQISVKSKYSLWVTSAEQAALARELARC